MLTAKQAYTIIENLRWSDIPKCVAFSQTVLPESQLSKWGLLNRVISLSSSSYDSRTKKMWKDQQRFIVRGARPIYCVVPQLINKPNDSGKFKKKLTGFAGVQTFSIASTYGDPFAYKSIPHRKVNVEAISDRWEVRNSTGHTFYDSCSCFEDYSTGQAIDDEKLFFWKVVNRAYREIYPKKQHEFERLLVQEISALSLLRLSGLEVHYNGLLMDRIKQYGKAAKLSSIASVFHILKMVEGIMNTVLDGAFIEE